MIKAGALVGVLRAAAMLSMLIFVSLMSSWMAQKYFGVLAFIISMATLAAGLGSFGQAEMTIRTAATRRAAGDKGHGRTCSMRGRGWSSGLAGRSGP